jgi:hypothetical protein
VSLEAALKFSIFRENRNAALSRCAYFCIEFDNVASAMGLLSNARVAEENNDRYFAKLSNFRNFTFWKQNRHISRASRN